MPNPILFSFLVDKENKKINVQRTFNAPVKMVWSAWTEPAILDQWWAPKPWRAETKSMDFSVGGTWHYCMVGPAGENQWCLLEYQMIDPVNSYSGLDAFCDENGVVSDTKPRAHWKNVFIDNNETTSVDIEISFDELSDLETIIQMGFKEGFTMCVKNLDQYFIDLGVGK